MSAAKIAVQRHSLDSAVSLSLRRTLEAPAVGVPLALVIPSIGVNSPLLAVGMTKLAAMAAPEGGAGSPDWSDTFWYRGSAVPGAVGTATIAGHIDDRFGDYAVFGRLSELVRGDRIYIRNTKTGFREQFVVTTSHAYTIAQATALPRARPDLWLRSTEGTTGPAVERWPGPSQSGHLRRSVATGTRHA
jgi:hypothetical protein